MDSPTSTSPSSPLFLLAGWRQHKLLTSSPTSSLSSSISSTWSTSSGNSGASSTQASLTCAFPSWPCRPSLSISPTLSVESTSFTASSNSSRSYSTWDVPNSFISDEDLFPEELNAECPFVYFDEAPPPPREPLPVIAPLPPLYASTKLKSGKKRRSSKQRGLKFAKPMSPISE